MNHKQHVYQTVSSTQASGEQLNPKTTVVISSSLDTSNILTNADPVNSEILQSELNPLTTQTVPKLSNFEKIPLHNTISTTTILPDILKIPPLKPQRAPKQEIAGFLKSNSHSNLHINSLATAESSNFSPSNFAQPINFNLLSPVSKTGSDLTNSDSASPASQSPNILPKQKGVLQQQFKNKESSPPNLPPKKNLNLRNIDSLLEHTKKPEMLVNPSKEMKKSLKKKNSDHDLFCVYGICFNENQDSSSSLVDSRQKNSAGQDKENEKPVKNLLDSPKILKNKLAQKISLGNSKSNDSSNFDPSTIYWNGF